MRDIIEEFRSDFEKHVASYYSKDKRLEHLVWGRPGHSNGYMEFIVSYGTLFVKGDYGDAVYVWYQEVDLEGIAGTDLHYFASKCQASEYGRGFKSWNEELLRKEIEGLLQEHEKNYEDYGYETPDELRKNFEEWGGPAAMNDEFGWMDWLGDYAYDVFGDEWYEYVPNGKYLDIRCQLHLAGLKLAVEALGE